MCSRLNCTNHLHHHPNLPKIKTKHHSRKNNNNELVSPDSAASAISPGYTPNGLKPHHLVTASASHHLESSNIKSDQHGNVHLPAGLNVKSIFNTCGPVNCGLAQNNNQLIQTGGLQVSGPIYTQFLESQTGIGVDTGGIDVAAGGLAVVGGSTLDTLTVTAPLV